MIHMNIDPEAIDAWRRKLKLLDAEFEKEMPARGFDPTQAETVALPSHLATLYAERARIKAEMEELVEERTND
jgi:DNA polymerase elongation subunit (family B)